jgi:hypothetical protein
MMITRSDTRKQRTLHRRSRLLLAHFSASIFVEYSFGASLDAIVKPFYVTEYVNISLYLRYRSLSSTLNIRILLRDTDVLIASGFRIGEAERVDRKRQTGIPVLRGWQVLRRCAASARDTLRGTDEIARMHCRA